MDDLNSSGGVIDYMGRNNGTAVNAVQTSAGKLGKGESFDGDGDYVRLSSVPSIAANQSYSVSVWIYTNSYPATNNYIWQTYGNNNLYHKNTNKFIFRGGDGTYAITSSGDYSVNNWYQVVAQREGLGNISLYVNGVLDTTISVGIWSGWSINFDIGKIVTANSNFFNGTIDDVMIFNRSLSADEILSIYNATKYQHTESNLIEGAHTFKAYTQDLAGNMNASDMIYFTTDTIYPSLVLLSPGNNTGDNDGNVSFIFNVTDSAGIANCSLVINNAINATNTTIVSGINTSFDVAGLDVGSYNWSINCSDSAGNVNNSETRKLAIVKTSAEFSGGTTDLSSVNISNITNLVLDSPNYGKINFSESVDLSAGGDIDSYVNISFNRIEINVSGLPALNKTARLSLYNLTYSNPRVLKDSAVCSDCTEVSYSGGVFVFDVTGFSVYSSEETPVAAATPDTSGSGEGGSALTSIIEDFSVDMNELKVRIVLNDVKEREIKIKNTGETNIIIKARLEGEGMEKIIAFENDKLSLLVGEEGVLKFNISARELEVYTGKIILSSRAKTKEVLIMINTQSKETLFDISLAIPGNIVNKDEALKAQISLIPVGEKGVDVTLKYLIKDFKGKVYYEESETFYIDNQKSFAKEFKIDRLEHGSYVLGIEMTYAGGFASTSSHFEVEEEEKPISFIKKYYMYFIILIVLIIAILFVIFELEKMQEYKRYKR
jgi:hypothetical protein